MKTFSLKLLLTCIIAFNFSCQSPKDTKDQPLTNNNHPKNFVEIKNINQSDPIPDNLIFDANFIPLSNFDKKENSTENIKIRLINSHIYIFNFVSMTFHSYNLQGEIEYRIDLKEHRDSNGKYYKASDFYIGENESVNFINSENAKVLSFAKNQFTGYKQFKFWGNDVEQLKNGNFIFYSGFVNDNFGKPYYAFVTDSNLNIKKTYIPVKDSELKVAEKVGTVKYHLFKSDSSINVLLDQYYSIYKYPDLKKPYYKIDFVNHKINSLEVISEEYGSSKFDNYAKINMFFENSNSVYFSYFYNSKLNYTIINKISKKQLNRANINSVNQFIIAKIGGVSNNNFLSLCSKEFIQEILKLNKNQHVIFKGFSPKNSEKMAYPVLVMFKLRDF